MKIVGTLALLLLCVSATGECGSTRRVQVRVKAHISSFLFHLVSSVSDSDSAETALSVSPGDIVLLPCDSGDEATKWLKDGGEIEASPSDPRVTVLRNGSLNIQPVVPGDEGLYLCRKLPQKAVRLRVTRKSVRHFKRLLHIEPV